MTTDSPVVVLFNSDGYEVNVKPNVSIPAGTTAILSAGTDGANSRFISVDSSGRQVVVGAGVAGTPAGSLITIQGDPAGVPVPISGTVSATNPSISSTGAAIPGSATQIGGSDGTNLQVPRVFDADTGGGIQYVLGVNLRLSSGGGSVEFGTASNPIRTDSTGTTTQPISAASLPLPTGASTEATLSTRLSDSTFTARINTLGQKTMANSTPVVLASDQTVIPVSQNGSWTVTSNAGTGNFNVIGIASDNTTNSTTKLPVLPARANTAAPTWTDGNQVPLSVDTSGALRITGTISASNASIGVNGAAIPTSSTQTGGTDGTNLQPFRVFDLDTGGGTQYVQGINLRLSSSGGSVEFGTATNPIRIDPIGTTTQPVSGTVTANAGTGNFTVVQATPGNLNATVVQGTASNLRTQTASESATGVAIPATANLAGGAVTTAAPTYTNGNLGALSLTTGGLLRVDGSTVTQPISGTVTVNAGTGTFTTQDTSSLVDNNTFTDNTSRVLPAGYYFDEVSGTALTENDIAAARIDSKRAQVLVIEDSTTRGQRATVSAAGAVKIDGSAVTQPVSGTIAATQSGTWTVQPGNTANTTPWLTTISQGGNSATVTASNALKVDGSAVTQPVSGTITANIGTTNGLALDVTLAKLTISQSAALGTNTQALLGGSVTTAAPTYTTGNINPFSLTTAGALRIDGSGSTQPVSGTVTANQGGTWNITNISGTISLPSGAATETSLAKLTQTQGSATSGQTGPLILGAVTTTAPSYTTGQSSPLSLDTTGALRITGSISASNPSVNTTGTTPPASATYIGGSVTTAAPIYTTGQMNALSLTTSGLLRIDGSGFTQSVSGTVTSNQGTAASLANAWSIKITDATNGPAAVKAASTLAVAADSALVVALNPASAGVKSGNATVTSVASSATSVTLLAANANRLGAVIVNDSTQILFVKFGTSATNASYTTAVPITRGVYEVPFGYTGIITGVWVSANGNARVTELTV